MAPLQTRGLWRGLGLACLALHMAQAPGAWALDDGRGEAGPIEEPGPQVTPPPDAPDLRPLGGGEALPHTHQGNLGPSGLKVSCSPSMIQVVAVEPGSPAALADVPNPVRLGRVRLVAVNGLPVEGLGRLVLLAAFHPSRGKVLLTFARPALGEPGESLVGPYELPLSVRGMAEQRAEWLAAQQRFAEAVGHLMERNVDASTVAEALLLGAQDAAAAEDWPRALNLAAAVPPSHPLHPQALGLKAMALDRVQRMLLRQSQLLGEGGQHLEALRLLEGLSTQAPYAGWRREAELRLQAAWQEAQLLRRNRGLPSPSPWSWSPPSPRATPTPPSAPALSPPYPSARPATPAPVPSARAPLPPPRPTGAVPPRPAGVLPQRPVPRPHLAPRPGRLMRTPVSFQRLPALTPRQAPAATRPPVSILRPTLRPRPAAQPLQPRPTRRPR